jgi:hypothetical protein
MVNGRLPEFAEWFIKLQELSKNTILCIYVKKLSNQWWHYIFTKLFFDFPKQSFDRLITHHTYFFAPPWAFRSDAQRAPLPTLQSWNISLRCTRRMLKGELGKIGQSTVRTKSLRLTCQMPYDGKRTKCSFAFLECIIQLFNLITVSFYFSLVRYWYKLVSILKIR